MTFSDEKAAMTKRKALYPEWKTSGIPIAKSCPNCTANYMKAVFNKKDGTKFQVICERCGHKLGT